MKYGPILHLLPWALAIVLAGPPRAASAAHGARPVAPARSVDVDIVKFSYSPASITVEPGTRVTWTNRDQTPHTVTGRHDKTPSSPALDTDDSYSYTFTKPGDFEYYCSLHPFMTGVVHVRQ